MRSHFPSTHLMLKYDPSPMEDQDGNMLEKIESRTFIIKISNNYIFYRQFTNDLRKFFENMRVELIRA